MIPKREKAQAGFNKVLKARILLIRQKGPLNTTSPSLLPGFVAMNHGQLTFPYKRYQIQPVWRADRPKKDATEFYPVPMPMWQEASHCSMKRNWPLFTTQHLPRLGLSGYELRINSRKMLSALANFVVGPTN